MNTVIQRFAESLQLHPSGLLTPAQVAVELGVSHRTLAAWRSSRNTGPAWMRIGSRVRYSKAALLAWLKDRSQKTSEA
ncbi:MULTISPECIES: helix-turn-helix transcriptional regulator [Pseudomonas]|uniref:helix-turn-helix transcriptional regulator n=1 Tax=Pseudomonas TaxID=286 RepID=UPI00089BA81A|nr:MULTISPECIES: helix-turn-helix domain-containing protein [Pseudomonas]KAA8706344.1 helix-turn-helix domain-containing protein [Pseudomonas proteolytica]MCR8934799.1 helix-turn-helix domain-containing protein [Pseudomonas sp. S11A4]MCR8973057.1 helix-turn-helix domain-containing protein [Pseudomonas sp. S11P7]TWR84256.1 helix-turn-helix domain-containing protein [Pseudomonas proteolytica]SED75397.1 Helix-turn-helix domain-containing protein [Pseudomonas proteolytica]